MRYTLFTVVTLAMLSPAAFAQKKGNIFIYEDEHGNRVITDRPPPEASELPKVIVNDEGVPVGRVRGKKTEEEIEQERLEAERQALMEERRKQEQALLYTYQNVGEIEMHRDRRLELFKAQVRVTELYLSNQRRQLDLMHRERSSYKPYSADPAAPQVPEDLVEDIQETEAVIRKHEENIEKYKQDERSIRERFDRDIARFKKLKGIADGADAGAATMTASQVTG